MVVTYDILGDIGVKNMSLNALSATGTIIMQGLVPRKVLRETRNMSTEKWSGRWVSPKARGVVVSHFLPTNLAAT